MTAQPGKQMKKAILLLVVSASFGFLQAQETGGEQPKPAKKAGITNDDNGREDQIIFDINHDRFLELPDGVEQSIWSRGVNIYGMYDLPIAKQNLSFAVGFGFSSSNYFLNSDIVDIDTTNGQTYSTLVPYDTDSIDFKRSKISANYIDVPVELRFRTNENAKGNRFKLAIGAKIGRKVNFHTKRIDENGDRFKAYVFPNVRDWRYGVTGRIGYGKVTISGYYSLVPLFEDNRGVELTPISIGISIIPF